MVPSSLQPFLKQITVKPLVPFYELPKLKADCKIVLAPLESTVFTESKSGLKFFEAAVLGSTVVASPIPDIDRFNSALLRKCLSLDDWRAALSRDACDDEMAERAAKLVADETCIDGQVSRWLSFAA